MKYTIILLLFSCALWGQNDTSSHPLGSKNITDSVKSNFIGETEHYDAADYWCSKGWDAEHNNKHKKAIKYYTKAIELNSKKTAAYYQRGFSKYCLNKYNEAIVDFTKAIELYPNEQFYLYRGYAKEGLKKYEEAIKDYDTIINITAFDATAYESRGDLKNKLKKYKEAIEDYNQAMRLSSDIYLYLSRGIAEFNLGSYNEAIDDFKKALEQKPNNKEFKKWLNKAQKKVAK